MDMDTRAQPGTQRLLWVTDPHLEKASQSAIDKLIQRLEVRDYDMALVTGDIATAATLPTILSDLAEACGERKMFMVLGNHDFRGASIRDTITRVDATCKRHGNLTHLATSAPKRITEHTTLVGHHGLTGCSRRRSHDAAESSEKILHGIFSAHKKRTRLLAATHYPPFRTSALFNDNPCDARKQAYFCNLPLGYLMIRMANQLRHLPIGVLAGHTHHANEDTILPNLTCRVGQAGRGHTGIQGILMV